MALTVADILKQREELSAKQKAEALHIPPIYNSIYLVVFLHFTQYPLVDSSSEHSAISHLHFLADSLIIPDLILTGSSTHRTAEAYRSPINKYKLSWDHINYAFATAKELSFFIRIRNIDAFYYIDSTMDYQIESLCLYAMHLLNNK